MDKQPLNYYRLSPKEVMDQLHTSSSGLSNAQAGERVGIETSWSQFIVPGQVLYS